MTIPAPLFDAAWYIAQVGRPLTDPDHHFRTTGDAAGLDPSPYFSTDFYKSTYPDWSASGAATALEDFLCHEQSGRFRRPHPLIDPAAYLGRYPDLEAADVCPTLHFASLGDAEGRSPSAAFDAGFYAGCYLPLGQTGAFAHYIRQGRAAGHLPAPDPERASRSQFTAAKAMDGLRNPVVLAVHDAQAAGAPILTLDLARELIRRGKSPVFLLLRGGPMIAEFRALGPVFLIAEGWDPRQLLTGIAVEVPVIVNSAVATELAQRGAETGHPSLLLIHEMRDYIVAQGLMPGLCAARDAGAQLGVSFPRMAEALRAELGGLPVLQPGIVLKPPPVSTFRQVRRRFAGRPVFIGAGHGDHRKGFDLFLDAAQGILQHLPDALFVWLGALDAWAQGLAAKAQAEGLPLLCPGFVPESLAWYAAARVYLLTSRQDPGPTTVIHAATMGVPFVGYATDIGLRGVADHLGRFVPADRPADFVRAALDLARHGNRVERRRLRRVVLKATSFGSYMDAILALVSPRP